uniref:Uncharacterized protein n=1 Tax=Brassica oleracea TaxID=3712 RepID=A0A3P6FJ70_BRAOL|nr:unnamed protein product [Brassica oleracea]
MGQESSGTWTNVRSLRDTPKLTSYRLLDRCCWVLVYAVLFRSGSMEI